MLNRAGRAAVSLLRTKQGGGFCPSAGKIIFLSDDGAAPGFSIQAPTATISWPLDNRAPGFYPKAGAGAIFPGATVQPSAAGKWIFGRSIYRPVAGKPAAQRAADGRAGAARTAGGAAKTRRLAFVGFSLRHRRRRDLLRRGGPSVQSPRWRSPASPITGRRWFPSDFRGDRPPPVQRPSAGGFSGGLGGDPIPFGGRTRRSPAAKPPVSCLRRGTASGSPGGGRLSILRPDGRWRGVRRCEPTARASDVTATAASLAVSVAVSLSPQRIGYRRHQFKIQ